MSAPQEICTTRARYQLAARGTLAPWLASALPPTLCFSDTHLVPRELPWSDDAPEDLLALLRALPEHAPLSLGDLTESVGLREADRDALRESPRLRDLWSTLSERRARVIVGNHDVRGEETLRALFGDERVFAGGFELGRVRVRHGHERSRPETELVRAVGPVAVPLYERGRRWLRRPAERLSNASVLGRVREGAPFVLFGHTHAAVIQDDAANPGCFLRSAQSFLCLDGDELALYRRD